MRCIVCQQNGIMAVMQMDNPFVLSRKGHFDTTETVINDDSRYCKYIGERSFSKIISIYLYTYTYTAVYIYIYKRRDDALFLRYEQVEGGGETDLTIGRLL